MTISQEDKTFTVLKYGLSKYLPVRIILRKDKDGKFNGLCEDSFSMNLSEYNVRIWWSGKAYSMLGEHNIDGIKDAEYNAKEGDLVVDPLSEDCPVEINWEKWLTATSKYNKRNALFKLKGSVV